MSLTVDRILAQLRSMGNPSNVEGMARFGISTEGTLGVSVTEMRKMARQIGHDHQVALGLWDSGIHEARILAALVDEPDKVTQRQMEAWVRDFDSWDVCDQVCGSLFDRTPFAHSKAVEWSRRDEEFVRRAGFVLMATLAVHDKGAPDRSFEKFFPLIVQGSTDDRRFVKKAVNWALRQIGKRNSGLHAKVIRLSEKIHKIDSRSARWIASDALRELRSEAVRARLAEKERPAKRRS